MLQSLQTDPYQKQIRQLLEDIKHNLKFLQKVAIDLGSLTGRKKDAQRDVLMERGEGLRVELKQKLKLMEVNVGEIVAMLDWKVGVVVKQLTKVQKQLKQHQQQSQSITTPPPQTLTKQSTSQSLTTHLKQITHLQQQIFQLQKRQNQHVKQMSQLKQKNAKLRQQFTNLSFDSNQRIKQLSERLHNNTSPNLGINKRVGSGNNGGNFNVGMGMKMETSYFLTNNNNNNDDLIEKKNNNTNFVKIKGTTINNNNILQMSPNNNNNFKIKTKNNLLDSFTSQSSEFDIKPYGQEGNDYEQSSSHKLMLGCFPGKQISQKTKTGSSSENKKLKFQQNCEKSRRFEFLLNNLIDDTSQNVQTSVQNIFPTIHPQSQLTTNGNGRYTSTQNQLIQKQQVNNYNQQLQNRGYRQKSYSRSPVIIGQNNQYDSRSNNQFNVIDVKRYQI